MSQAHAADRHETPRHVALAVARNRSAATDSARAASQAIASLFEEEIRGRPNQWLWMYKRWKYKDPAEPDAAYPFYAKELRRAP